MSTLLIPRVLALLCSVLVLGSRSMRAQPNPAADTVSTRADAVLKRVAEHDFNPVRDGFTFDRHLNKHGVASLSDTDWLVRTLAVRDLVRLAAPAIPALRSALNDTNRHVRHVAVMALGLLQATNAAPALEKALKQDRNSVVRSQAAIALGHIGPPACVATLRSAQRDDPARDVQHQAEVAAYAVERGIRPTPELAQAWATLDESKFGRVQVGQPARDFQLADTEGKPWRLSDFRGRKPVLLIWIFADWCPVCHGEFRELIELRREFEAADIQVFTLECHDLFPCRVMVGKELDPKYWFSKTSFKESYTQKIWWPHLADRAGAVGAEYGVQPMTFAVHAEYINRPSVVMVDKAGLVRFAYYGTFWGDRPSIRRALDMMRQGDYSFAAPKRLKAAPSP
jgi:alkyl hydroperoxide reductase subunit AhpC